MSTAGKARGQADERTQEWQGIVEYIEEKQPTVFFLENATSLATVFADLFEEIVERIRSVDVNSEPRYEARWNILNALEHGAPQHRRRVYVVGIKHSKLCR